MEEKQTKNLFNKLITDENSVFYAADRIIKTLINKGRKSSYEKDKVFYKLFNVIENRNIIYENEKERLPVYTPFTEQKKDKDRSTLYTINGPLQFFHADIAYINFLAKSAVDPKFALVCVYLFTSKVYIYTMKKRSNLVNKLEIFYREIQPKRRENKRMRLQTDLEFQQNEIKKLNLKYNVEMFSSRLRGGKAFAAEQKIREFKKILFKSKRLHKILNSKKRLNSKNIIKKAVENMNKTNSQKYGLPPEIIGKKTLADDVYREVYDFYRLVKVSKAHNRYERYDLELDTKKKKKLREPLEIGEKVLVLAERIKKKDAPGVLFKSTTENIPFFNKKEIFTIEKSILIENVYNYWVKKENGENINKRFIRQELFALKNNFK